MRAVEVVVGEVAEVFLGEDPALPALREMIDCVTERLADARQEAERYTGPIAISAPDEELLAKVRRLVRGPAMQFAPDARAADLGA